jgi:hypothetical protein
MIISFRDVIMPDYKRRFPGAVNLVAENECEKELFAAPHGREIEICDCLPVCRQFFFGA